MPSIILNSFNLTLYYSTLEAVIKNPIGKVSATLIEYVITLDKEETSDVFCKLYKTKEGFWYDPTNHDDRIDTKTKHYIKAAIDAMETKNSRPKPFHI